MTRCSNFDPTQSILAGRDTAVMQADLARLQQAYIDVSAGGKIVTVSYTQGDGAKTVSYSQANLADLVAAIQLLQQQLGIVDRPRKPIRFVFPRK